MEDIGPPPGLELPEENLDYWTKEGITWTRHHATPRTTLFDPQSTPDGPDHRKLVKDRTTTLNYSTGTTDQIEDDWTHPPNTTKDVTQRWRGTTVFRESEHYPQVLHDDITTES